MKKMFLALCISFISSHVMGANPATTTQTTQATSTIQSLVAQIAANSCPYPDACQMGAFGDESSRVDCISGDRLRSGETGECARLLALHKQFRIALQHQYPERR